MGLLFFFDIEEGLVLLTSITVEGALVEGM